MSRTYQIDENDHHALRLMREHFQLDKVIKEYEQECLKALYDTDDVVLSADKYIEIETRLKRIGHALDQWSKGENILVAMLADDRADEQDDQTKLFAGLFNNPIAILKPLVSKKQVLNHLNQMNAARIAVQQAAAMKGNGQK